MQLLLPDVIIHNQLLDHHFQQSDHHRVGQAHADAGSWNELWRFDVRFAYWFDRILPDLIQEVVDIATVGLAHLPVIDDLALIADGDGHPLILITLLFIRLEQKLFGL